MDILCRYADLVMLQNPIACPGCEYWKDCPAPGATRKEGTMNRDELMAQFLATRIPASESRRRAVTARRPTYTVCRNCGSMMIQDSRGGLVCADGCAGTNRGDVSSSALQRFTREDT
jgi:hypothetical protein